MIEKNVLENYVNKGFSIREVAIKLCVCDATVKKYLNVFNLKTKWRGGLIHKFSDKQITNAYKQSDSYNDFLKRLGANSTGGAFYHYKKRLKNLGLDFEVWRKESGQVIGGKKSAKAQNQKALKGKKRLKRSILKKFLDLNNIEEKCNECNIKVWRGKQIKLHIHHKDKNKTNNQLDNLEYLCPNCHSLNHF